MNMDKLEMAILIVCTTPDERAEMALKEARSMGCRCVFCGDKADSRTLALADI